MALPHRLVRLTPAFSVFPSLQRFAPNFAPRCIFRRKTFRRLPPESSQRMLHSQILSFYHDLGVLAFAGASVEQVDRIARLIQRAVANDTLQSCPNTWYLSGIIRKRARYRLPTEDWHIDPNHRPEDGILSAEGILYLSKQAAFKWAEEALEKLDDVELKEKALTVREDFIHIKQGQFAKGIIHHTVNGPRRLPVDAFVRIEEIKGRCVLHVELFTVGAAQFVGRATMRLIFFEVSDLKETLPTGSLLRILEGYQSPDIPDDTVLQAFTRDLAQLEEEIWIRRVPESFREAIQGDLTRDGTPSPWAFGFHQRDSED